MASSGDGNDQKCGEGDEGDDRHEGATTRRTTPSRFTDPTDDVVDKPAAAGNLQALGEFRE